MQTLPGNGLKENSASVKLLFLSDCVVFWPLFCNEARKVTVISADHLSAVNYSENLFKWKHLEKLFTHISLELAVLTEAKCKLQVVQ